MPDNNLKNIANNATGNKTGSIGGKAGDILDNISNSKKDDQKLEQNALEQGLQPGDKVAPGKELDENGKIKETSTQRLQNVVARGVAAHFSGGNEKFDKVVKNISENKLGNQISNQLEKNVVISKSADALEENGGMEIAEGALDGATAFSKGDIKGTVDGAKKLVKGQKKFQKVLLKRVLISALISFGILFMIFFVIATPYIIGYMELSDRFNWGEPGSGEVDPDNPDNPNDPPIDRPKCAKGAVASNPKVIGLFGTDCIPNSDAEMRKYMVNITVDINTPSGKSTKTLTVHKNVADVVKKIFAQIYSSGALINPAKTSCYNFRDMVTKAGELSAHSFGIACDVNYDVNPLCYKNQSCYSNAPTGQYSNVGKIANAFKSNGWKWGGDWISYKDWMHFSLTGN